MFPLRRSTKEPEIDWPALLALLEDDDRRATIARLAPTPGRESYLTALRRMQSSVVAETLTAGRRLDTAGRLVDRPTIAVAGMLNSGKTSLVSSFLSPAGQARTLRGTSNREGTHRFVLWLPQSWRDDVELWSLLVSRIGDSLGHPPEDLSENPDQAASQYNNRSGDHSQLSVALLATDPALDELGVGLLDCPDIVSDEELGLGSPKERKELLGRAATLCSAFLIVTDAASSRDTTLADLMRIASDLMPGVPRMLAVNKVRPRQTPDQVHETFSPLSQKHGVASIYAAYDYDVPASRPFIPHREDEASDRRLANPMDSSTGKVESSETAQESEPLPVFFEVSPNPDENPPASIDEGRFLESLPLKLDRGVLFSQLHRALRINLEKVIWDRGLDAIRRNADASFAKTRECHEVLLDASLEFFAHRKIGGEVMELRLHQSERILRQLSESFAATAPWYARWGVRLNSTIRRFVGGAGDFMRSLTPSALSQKAADDIKGRFRSGEYGGLIAPEGLLAEIERHGGTVVLSHYRDHQTEASPGKHSIDDSGLSLEEPNEEGTVTISNQRGFVNDAELLLPPIQRAVTRFEQDDFTTLDPRRLDEAIRMMWSEIPMHKKLAHGLTPLATIFAAFGAALMIPVDFGHSFILAASIPELLAAAGLGALAAMWAGNQGAREVGQQAARQQLADFLAVLCDELGVARPDPPMKVRVANHQVTLPASRIARSETSGPTMPVYRVRDEFVSELNKLLPRSSGIKK
ncbi:hypothetical protein [Rhodopirellula sallentina]|uniref:Putative membrane protein n=1 Tax=Rhodopirellula sallentina SM41 TaxID=1263870 RepID=M5UFB6_9BACT|nr:hypothetical protein [Rhodopirellula sallentina]EMI56541.1 putative membrane protein [Rhodopirellula sallentina SM41]